MSVKLDVCKIIYESNDIKTREKIDMINDIRYLDERKDQSHGIFAANHQIDKKYDVLHRAEKNIEKGIEKRWMDRIKDLEAKKSSGAISKKQYEIDKLKNYKKLLKSKWNANKIFEKEKRNLFGSKLSVGNRYETGIHPKEIIKNMRSKASYRGILKVAKAIK